MWIICKNKSNLRRGDQIAMPDEINKGRADAEVGL